MGWDTRSGRLGHPGSVERLPRARDPEHQGGLAQLAERVPVSRTRAHVRAPTESRRNQAVSVPFPVGDSRG